MRVPGQRARWSTELKAPTQQWSGSALEGRKVISRYNGSNEKYNKLNKRRKKKHPMNMTFSRRAALETALETALSAPVKGSISTAIQGN